MRRRVLLPLVLPAVLIGCETETNIPTEPREEVLRDLDYVLLDRSTLALPDGSVAAGETVRFHAKLSYHVSESQLERWRDPSTLGGVYLEAAVLEGSGYRGPLELGEVAYIFPDPDVDVAEGGLTLDVDVPVPEVSPYCRSYDRFGAVGFIGTDRLFEDVDEELGPGTAVSEKTVGFPEVDMETVTATGTSEPAGPCGMFVPSCSNVESVFCSGAYWGGTRLVRIRNAPDPARRELPGSTSPVRFTIGGQPASILLETYDEARGWARYLVWVPAGLTGGPHEIRASTDAGEITYGNDRPSVLYIEGAEDNYDWQWGGNDSFDEANDFNFPYGLSGVLFVNPELAMTVEDRAVDPSANPMGSSDWGVGDWFAVAVESSMDLCAKVEPSTGDDIDLLLFDAAGNLVASAETAGDAAESLRVDGLAAGSDLRMWVAPADIATEVGIYALKVWDCAVSEPIVD